MPRLVRCVLSDRTHSLPMPDRGFRLFSPDGETVDLEDAFWSRCLADSSIAVAPKSEPQRPDTVKPGAESRRAVSDRS